MPRVRRRMRARRRRRLPTSASRLRRVDAGPASLKKLPGLEVKAGIIIRYIVHSMYGFWYIGLIIWYMPASRMYQLFYCWPQIYQCTNFF